MSDTKTTTKRTPEDTTKPIGMKIRWPEKFGDRVVTINATTFDSRIHQKVGDK